MLAVVLGAGDEALLQAPIPGTAVHCRWIRLTHAELCDCYDPSGGS